MLLEEFNDPTSLSRVYKLTITDKDLHDIYLKMTPYDKMMVEYCGRDESTLEEKLMGLQVYARVLEQGVTA